MPKARRQRFDRQNAAWTTAAAALLLTFLGLSEVNGQGPRRGGTPPGRFPVVGYVPEYRINALDPSVGESITDLIFFSIEPRPTGDLSVARMAPPVLEKLQLIKARHKTRILVSVGGWERSQGFAPLAQSATARQRFTANLTRFCVDHRFDGADIDWEHPANANENQGYGALLVELRRAFQPRGLLLTMALADWQDPGPIAYQAVDRIHVMAYDHDEPHHSTLDHAKADLNAFVARGVPRTKLSLGLPFYGRNIKDHSVEATYAELVNKYKPPRDADLAGGFYFNGINTVQQKTRYALDQGFGGVMIWELGQDATGSASLLRAVREVVPR